MKRRWKIILIIFLVIGLGLVWFGESRKFYCLDNDRCVTVWKTYNNTCYIIPGKYYGILKSADNYIQTTNIDNVDIIWSTEKNVLVAGGASLKIVNNDSTELKMNNYKSNKSYNDILYLDFDGNYHRYKKNVNYISLSIKENYARVQGGKKL
ncbi:hypothetical protein D9M68_532880 [compost metagenome]